MDPQSPISQTEGDEWSPIRETINILCLAICQIEATLSDSNHSVNTLTQSFTALVNHTQDMNVRVQHLSQPDELARFQHDFTNTVNEMTTNVQASINAFQFYDRVCQRLDHVSRSLEKVSDVLASQTRLNDPDLWHSIQKDIKSSYTMQAEHTMYDHIMNGGSIKSALAIYQKQLPDDPLAHNDIELF